MLKTSFIYRFFELNERQSTIGQEFRGAFATFLTMAYILFANPGILAAAGVPFASAVACTALAAGISCIIMGLYANFPLALASGMGLNAVVAFQLSKIAGSWQTAMGLVVLDGVVVLLLVLFGVREAMMHAIPKDLRRAIGAGIGLFIAFIGVVNARLVIVAPGTLDVLKQFKSPFDGPVLPPVSFGSLHHPETMTAMIGLLVIAILLAKKVKGSIVLGILISTVVAFLLGIARLPQEFHWPSFEIAFKADVLGAMRLEFIPLLLALVLVDFFDTLGTTTAIAEQANLQDSEGSIPRLKRILGVDAISASLGGLLGASSVTCYIESAAGVSEGARTGLHSVFVGGFFLLAILAAPVAGIVPAAATAPALIIVGFLMVEQVTKIEFSRLETALPSFVTLIVMPFTYSITHGIGFGFVTYTAIKILTGKFKEVHPLMYSAAVLFTIYFIES